MGTNTGTKNRNGKGHVLPKQSLGKLQEKAQKVFNAWIRQRDEGKPCISCGSYSANQAGHLYPVKGYSALRYDEMNVHLQCAGCNLFKHGNQLEYRRGLVRRYGVEYVEELESKAENKVHKWSRESLTLIIEKYDTKSNS